MISTAVSRASSRSGFDYVLNEEKGEELCRNGLLGDSGQELENEFREYAQKNVRLQNNQINLILSPDKNQSDFTNDQLRELTQKHLKNLGLEKQPYIACVHTNTADKHVHILVSRADGTGHVSKDNFIGQKAVESANQLARESYQYTAQQSVSMVKADIKQAITEALKESPNIEHLNKSLANNGIVLEPIYKGKTTQIQGFKVHSGEHHFKLSQVDRGLSKSIQRTLSQNNEIVKEAAQLFKDRGSLPVKAENAIMNVLNRVAKEMPGTSTVLSAVNIMSSVSNPVSLAKSIINVACHVMDRGMGMSM